MQIFQKRPVGDPKDNTGLPIIQYWHSDTPPDEISGLTETFRTKNPGTHHVLFNEESAAEFIAEHFTDRELKAFRACAVPAMQADYLRYCAVFVLGGIYVDADFRCRAPLGSLSESADRGVLFRREISGIVVNGFFIFTAPNHPLLALSIAVATRNIERRIDRGVHAVTGPMIFTGLRALGQLNSFATLRQDAVGLGLTSWIDAMEEAIPEESAVRTAFDGVRVDRFDRAMRWIDTAGIALRYKQGPTHWPNWQRHGRSVYR